jgi:hypothetical protein
MVSTVGPVSAEAVSELPAGPSARDLLALDTCRRMALTGQVAGCGQPDRPAPTMTTLLIGRSAIRIWV